jgi:two-component system NarL family response regulator
MNRLKPTNPIRLLLVDDHPAFRKGIAALIESEPGLEVVAQTGDGWEALGLYRQTKPDVVLMDLHLPGLSGVEVTLSIRKEFPDARVVVLTTFDRDEDIYRAVQSGAKSFLLKDAPEDELAATIRAVHAGQPAFSPRLTKRLADRRQRADLSVREMEVLQLIIKGRSNKEISSSLQLAEETVKAYMKTLFMKLNVHDRTQAAISAIRQGIVHLE